MKYIKFTIVTFLFMICCSTSYAFSFAHCVNGSHRAYNWKDFSCVELPEGISWVPYSPNYPHSSNKCTRKPDFIGYCSYK